MEKEMEKKVIELNKVSVFLEFALDRVPLQHLTLENIDHPIQEEQAHQFFR